MEPLLVLLLGALVLFIAAAVQGLAGFGSGLIIVPLMVLFLEPRTVIPLALLQGTFMNTVLFLTRTRSARIGKVLPLFISAAFGLPLGTLLLLTVGSDLLRVAIGAVIIVSSLLLLFLRPRAKESGMPATLAIGLTSGVLNGAISMSGPPVVLAFQREGMGKERFRANLAGYFLSLNLLTLLLFAATGVLTMDVWGLSLVLLPSTAMGLVIGMAFSRNFREGRFRTVVLIIAAVSGMLSLAAGAHALMG
ncbi:MAG: sulfite exporter TauE/SafE family protein [Candidatus Thermoplasmatota archaeon]|nr:sulfite exporter TauE/SafE family protein [Candidatus Thermoplasmatota archaeon]